MFALIFENRIVEIAQNQFPVASEMQWVTCDNAAEVGWFYIDGVFKDSLESDEEFLVKLKTKKLKELDDYYNSDECWMYKIQSAVLGASITQAADWFRGMIPVCAGRQFIMFTDAGTISIALAKEKADNINYKIQVEASFALRIKKNELEALINNSTLEELQNLNVKTYLGEVPRVIEIDNL